MNMSMNEYMQIGAAAAAAALVIYAIVRAKFGDGLLTRFLGVMMPAVIVVGYIGFVLGSQGISALGLVIAFGVSISFIIAMILMIQRSVIARIMGQADAVLAVVDKLSVTSQEAAASVEEQASAVAQVTSSVEEIHRMSRSTSETAQSVVKAADRAVSKGREGMTSVRDVVQIMKRFAQTDDFVQVVGEVAEQSNLLAVNAGIEASKAGNLGRGFSVVASEVRNLAEQSKEAAKQIRRSINQTNMGQEALATTDNVISSLGGVLQETSDQARQISGAVVQQSAGLQQISDAMGNLSQSGKNSALASQQIHQAAEELTQVSRRLVGVIHGTSGQRPQR